VLAIWAVLGVFILTGLNAFTAVVDLEQSIAFYLLFIVLFYWIDRSVLASRRSDPLLRDTLHWSKLRLVLWAGVIITTVIPFVILGYVVATSNNALFAQMNNGTLGGPAIIDLIFGFMQNFPIIIPIVGLVYFPIISIRSKWDRNLRRHFIWFVPASLCLLLLFFGFSLPQPIGQFYSPFIVVVMGYSLYRSAKALVPLNLVSAT